jgi:hypothetical protein
LTTAKEDRDEKRDILERIKADDEIHKYNAFRSL